MYSISFPNIFSSTTTKLDKDNNATSNNLQLVLCSNKNSLLCDPGFGTNLGYLFFDQNSDDIIPELVVDQIYTAIQEFMPQLLVKREDITMKLDKTKVIINIKALNLINYELDNYSLDLVAPEE